MNIPASNSAIPATSSAILDAIVRRLFTDTYDNLGTRSSLSTIEDTWDVNSSFDDAKHAGGAIATHLISGISFIFSSNLILLV